MPLKQQQQIKQQQRLTPQQILTIRLLEMPVIEMENRVKHELDENPALEEGKDFTAGEVEGDGYLDADNDSNGMSDTGPEEDLSLGDYMSDDDIPAYKLAEMAGKEERSEFASFNNEQSLQDFLTQQLQLHELSEDDIKTGEYIIGNIDRDGYMRRLPSEIADDMAFQTGSDISPSKISEIIKVIQDFDPPGICARDLQECLLIQMKKRTGTPDTDLALKILNGYFDDFTEKHYEKIQKELNIDEGQMKSAIHEITSLNPKPGAGWDDYMSATMNHITPDFIVETHNGDITLSLNCRSVPPLRINREYAGMFNDYTSKKANQTSEMRNAIAFVKQKVDSARGFIDAVRQRQETLQRTMEAIIILQREFFLSGDESKLHPMILKDVAAHSGYDVSTVSRVSNSKYVQTNFGIYPLKYFFSESTQTESGEAVATRQVKQIIKDIVAGEDKKNPIADGKLSDMLKAKGFIVARRTIAKYREQMGIATSRMRKEL